jgi:hypothetical protein
MRSQEPQSNERHSMRQKTKQVSSVRIPEVKDSHVVGRVIVVLELVD